MSRQATGTVEYRQATSTAPAGWWARITCADGSRPWIRLKGLWPNTPTGKRRAKEAAAHYAETFRARGIVGVPRRGAKSGSDGLSDWFLRYFEFRAALGIEDRRGAYKLHLQPVMAKDPTTATLDDSRKLRTHLDRLVAAKRMSWKTAFNIWTLWTTACKAACGRWAKDKDGAAFRVRPDYICEGVSPPDRDDPKQLQFLYPDEFLALLSCERVPLMARRMYACAVYLFVRAGELRALTWDDLDLVHGVVSIRHSYDQETKAIKQTKTGNKGLRRFAIERELLPLLRVMRDHSSKTAPVFVMPDRKHWADDLREHLALAGVTRADLFKSDDTSKQIRFHDLRSTGLTWLALRGDEHLKIQSRAGHRTFTMTEKYIRMCEMLPGEGIGSPFPPLPAALLECPAECADHSSEDENKLAEGQFPGRYSSAGIVPELASTRNYSGGAGNRTATEPFDGNNAAQSATVDLVQASASARTLANHDASRSVGDDSKLPLAGVVETALARALEAATKSQRWELVAQIASELTERRRAREGSCAAEVVTLPTKGNSRSARIGG